MKKLQEFNLTTVANARHNPLLKNSSGLSFRGAAGDSELAREESCKPFISRARFFAQFILSETQGFFATLRMTRFDCAFHQPDSGEIVKGLLENHPWRSFPRKRESMSQTSAPKPRRLASIVSPAGFSMLELLVSVAIITLIMGAVFQFMAQVQKRYQGNQTITESNQSARAALEVMTQEIGQAGYNSNPNPNTSQPAENTYQLPYVNGILYDSSLSQSNDHTLDFYGDINNDGNQDYVSYSLYAPPGAPSVTINGVPYTLYTLYRSFTQLPTTTPPLPAVTSQPAYPMVQNVLYNIASGKGPSAQPIFSFSGTSQILIVPNNITVVGTVVINLCVAINPRSMETNTVQWYTMSTQIRPVNLAAGAEINNENASVYLPAPLVPNASAITIPPNYYQ
jgi:prepilin-type N-terminal cleavage/methylation domain-containing protein